jgi:uncharacterized protein (TIGR00730 family)
MRVGIFCSSRSIAVELFEQSAMDVMEVLYKIGIRDIVYGGGKYGLMGIVHRESVRYSMNIIGHNLEKWSDPECDHEVLYHTLLERQNGLISACDVFIALPGGIGTIYEISQVLCHNDVEGLNKPVLLYNTRSFYTNFVNTLKDIAHTGLISNELSLALINSKEELESIIKNEIK